MERIRRLRSFWSWLPVFRVAAETEHLPTAAQSLYLSASSISRTIKQLEDELGKSLFVREGRTIKLSGEGKLFLGYVRDAMRLLDEGVEALSKSSLTGTIDLATPRDLSDLMVTPVLANLRHRAPELCVRLQETSDEAVNALLLGGRLDVALVRRPQPNNDVIVERLVTLSRGVYVRPGHPLTTRQGLTLAELEGFEQVATPDDGWPVERPRRLGAQLPSAALARSLCAATELLAILPDGSGRSRAAVNEPLVRLALDELPPIVVYLVSRRPVVRHERTELVLDALRAYVQANDGTH